LLRSLNRMNDVVAVARVEGAVWLGGCNIYDRRVDAAAVRRAIGMVFQRPNPFPMSIYDNVAFGLRLVGMKRSVVDERVEESLRQAELWDEAKDRLRS